MMRRIAVVGDKLENDGAIAPYEGPVFHIGDHGHQVALIGGDAYCPVCKSLGAIDKSGGPRRIEFFTGEIALHDDVVRCRCSPSPRIVATLAGETWHDDMVETFGVVDSAARPSDPVPQHHRGVYDEQIRVISSDTALDGYPYFIETADGQILSGNVKANGALPPVITEADAELFTVYWGDDALERLIDNGGSAHA